VQDRHRDLGEIIEHHYIDGTTAHLIEQDVVAVTPKSGGVSDTQHAASLADLDGRGCPGALSTFEAVRGSFAIEADTRRARVHIADAGERVDVDDGIRSAIELHDRRKVHVRTGNSAPARELSSSTVSAPQ
jgi:hypothetical protein